MASLAGRYLELCKPRVVYLIVFTAVVGMFLAVPGWPPWNALLAGTLGIGLAAASAAAINHLLDQRIDAVMARTRNRPLPSGQLSVQQVLIFAFTLGLLSMVLLITWVNALTAVLTFLSLIGYAIVYTVWLKRRSWTNIVIGGASGSFAVLAGAAAVDPGLGPIPIWLALALFFWTPSHFWALAIAKHKDYARTGVPMLPIVVGNRRCARIVLVNTLILVACAVMPVFYGMGWIYALASIGGGAYFIYHNLLMVRDPSPRVAMRCFAASLLQLVLLLSGAVLDVWILG